MYKATNGTIRWDGNHSREAHQNLLMVYVNFSYYDDNNNINNELASLQKA
jgi:hypothetical protein